MVLDLHMPEKDGFQVARELRAHERGTGKHLPVIAVTARSSAGDREEALTAGMDEFLSKPIEADVLYAAIDRVVATLGRGRQPQPHLLDPAAIVLMCGGEAAILAKLCVVFRRTLPEQMKRARGALGDQDLGSLREAAQMLVGTVGAFSRTAGAVASALEHDAIREDLDSCKVLVARLDGMCSQLIEQTRSLTVTLGVSSTRRTKGWCRDGRTRW
jgi:DNA-binding response OmpR family regulator